MPVATNLSLKWTTSAWSAPLLNSAATASTPNTTLFQLMNGWTHPAATTGLRGGRATLASAIDLSASPFVTFKAFTTTYNLPGVYASSTATGGIRVYFVDSVGAWAAFNVYGRDVTGYDGDARDSYFTSNTPDAQFVVDRAATPDASSGTINWASIAAIEAHVNMQTSAASSLGVGDLWSVDRPLITGTTTMAQIAAAYTGLNWNSATNRTLFRRVPARWSASAPQVIYQSMLGMRIGNASTATTMNESAFAVALVPLHQDQTASVASLGRFSVTTATRDITVEQSATDSVQWSDFSISGSSLWTLTVSGSTSGTAAFTRGAFYRATNITAAHGRFVGCIFEDCRSLSVTDASVVTGATLRNASKSTDTGLTVLGSAGDYSAITATFSNNLGKDITVGAGGAGTYILSGCASAGTLKIHNASATDAVIVRLATGQAYSTSTAGGAISVEYPAVYQSVTLTGGVAGSRVQLFDTTSSTELYNAVPGAWPFTWTDPAAYAADRAIRLRVAGPCSTTCYAFLDTPIGTSTETTPALAYLLVPAADEVYNANAVVGSSVTGVTIDDSLLRVSVTTSTISLASLYAYESHWLTTEEGIRDEGRIITAIDQANYRFENFEVRNDGAGALTITGGYCWDSAAGQSDPSALFDLTGGFIFLAPPHVVNNVVTVSGASVITGDIADIAPAVWSAGTRTLTSAAPPTAEQVAEATRTELAPELAKLDGLTLSGGNVLADVRAVVGVGLAGTGVPPTFNDDGAMTSPGDPWRAA